MKCCRGRLSSGGFFGGVARHLGDSNAVKRRLCGQEAVLENGTTAFENWISTGVTVYRQFWVFNVTNPEEVVKDGATPVVSEKGPYTYK